MMGPWDELRPELPLMPPRMRQLFYVRLRASSAMGRVLLRARVKNALRGRSFSRRSVCEVHQ